MIIFFTTMTTNVFAAKNETPDEEVKFLLASELDKDNYGNLLNELRELFEMTAEYDSLAIAFIDTDAQAFNEQLWSNRILYIAGDSNFQLTDKSDMRLLVMTSQEF